MSNKEIKEELRFILKKAVDELSDNYQGSSLTDIFIIVDQESSEIAIYDDENNCIIKEIVASWSDLYNVYEEDISGSCYARDLRNVVASMDMEDDFSALNIYTPFSVNLADENFIVLEELLLIEDDSVIKLENDFMAKMDKDFEAFLDRLMNE